MRSPTDRASRENLVLVVGEPPVRLIFKGSDGFSVLASDVAESSMGEVLASLLLAAPQVEEGKELYDALLKEYIVRIYRDELWRLYRLFDQAYGHVIMAPIAPLVMHMSRLASLYPWLRPLYNKALSSSKWLARLNEYGMHVAKELGLETSTKIVRTTSAKLPPKPQTRYTSSLRDVIEAYDAIQELLSPQRVAEGLTSKLHPLLRDPLLLIRLDRAKIATRLLSFEDHLYRLTGVSKLIKTLRRYSAIRSTRKVVVEGFTTAVVKDYTSPIAAKWLIAAILTLHLPKPRLAPKKRLTAEYHYTCLLLDKGYNVHEPILVDVRRKRAAYKYVEGVNLAELLKKTPTPPHYRSLGMLLASLHSDGISLWDSNPTNIVATPTGELYIVDLEQARSNPGLEEKTWDLVLAVYYTGIYSPRETHTRAKMVAEGYLDAGGDPRVVREAAKPKYMLPFTVAIAPTVLDKARRTFAYIAESYV